MSGSNCERQPRKVSETLAVYLNMTAPRERRRPSPRRPEEQRRTERNPLIDNEGLTLDEGNDFA
jgi:hypothetical protein